MINQEELKHYLDKCVEKYNCIDFIVNDPISIPHQFSKKQDIEIIGFIVAILSWGQRKTIINKGNELVQRMDYQPHDFILNHTENDLKSIADFKHRTFNGTDILYFIDFFKRFYSENESLETAFITPHQAEEITIEKSLNQFFNLFFEIEYAPHRTRKHISSPDRKSACKRINMYLRWMVRKDTKGVDFGIWNTLKMSQLVCPCDVHVERVARQFSLIQRKGMDWQTALELTNSLKEFDALDPVKYDFALFGLGVNE